MMTRRNMERFQRFLNNPLNQTENETLLNQLANPKHIKFIIHDLCLTEEMFYSASLKTLEIWSIKIQDQPKFSNRENTLQILNTFKIFIIFCYSIENIKKTIKTEERESTTIVKNPTLIKIELKSEPLETTIYNLSININLILNNPFLLNYHYTAPPFFPSLYQHNTHLKAA